MNKRFVVLLVLQCLFVGCDSGSSESVALPDRNNPIIYEFLIDKSNRGGNLSIKGLITQNGTNLNAKAALLTLRYYDQGGNFCGFGNLQETYIFEYRCGYSYLATKPGKKGFLCRVKIPANAAKVKIGFCRFFNNYDLQLRDLEVSLTKSPEQLYSVRFIGWFVRRPILSIGLLLGLAFCVVGFAVYLYWSRYGIEQSVFHFSIFASILSVCVLVSSITHPLEGLLSFLVIVCFLLSFRRISIITCRDVFVFVLATGLVLRLVSVFVIRVEPYSDFENFWKQIVDWSQFKIVGTKSYPTVLFYSMFVHLFGNHYAVIGVLNCALGLIQILLAKFVASAIFNNRLCGVSAAALIALNPVLIVITPSIASEIIYGTLLLASFAVFMVIYRRIVQGQIGNLRTLLWAFIAGVVCGVAVFARGNAVGVIPAGMLMLLLLSMRLRCIWALFRYVVIPFTLAGFVMIALMCLLTQKTIGYMCPTGSNQQAWTYLFGSNIEMDGNGTMEDSRLIFRIYEQKYPGARFDIRIARPLIMEEFKKRWSDNPYAEVALSLNKHKWLWTSNGLWAYAMCHRHGQPSRLLTIVLRDGVQVFRSLLVISFAVGMVLLWLSRKLEPCEQSVMVETFFLSNVALNFVTVWTPRYSYTLWIILPILACSPLVLLSMSNLRNLVQSVWIKQETKALRA